MAKVRVVLNRAGISALLKSSEVGDHLEGLAKAAAPAGTEVTNIVGRTRRNIRIADHSRDALDRESKTGHLSRALGRVV